MLNFTEALFLGDKPLFVGEAVLKNVFESSGDAKGIEHIFRASVRDFREVELWVNDVDEFLLLESIVLSSDVVQEVDEVLE